MSQRAQGRFEGKVVVVTGASAGIGGACAREFAAAGATVVLVARTKRTLDEVAAEIEREGGRAVVMPTDLADPEAAWALLDRVSAKLGGVDIVVNNAGAHHRGPVEDRTAEELRQMVQVNLLAPMLLMRAAIPHLRRRGGGTIVNVASLAGRVPVPDAAAYCATKAGLRAFGFALADELAGSGVRIAAVSPGPVDTGFLMNDLENVPDIIFSQPMSTSEEVAALVIASALDGARERTTSAMSSLLTTVGYLVPPLRRVLAPALKRRGHAVKQRYLARAGGDQKP